MISDEILSEVFAEHAEQRPDAQQVLASVHQRAARQRGITVTRAATALGAAAAVTAVAVGMRVVTDRQTGHGTAPGGGGARPVASRAIGTVSRLPQPTHTQSTATAAHPSPASTVGAGSRNYVTIAAGWLPGKVKHESAQNQRGFEEHDYTVSVAGTDLDVIIWMEDGKALPTRTEAGRNYRDLTINGHPAREFVSTVATIVAIDVGHGKIAFAGPSVVATNKLVTTMRISSIALHVARSIEYGRHDPIPSN